ncbi:hypothetical protein HPP92_009464 [Vanilla planifolia]|uniref:Uncharacterized protein n=1 Tax=Vanilla planifolia TaxID=51239 RepID=A0A835RAB9_VANPL|nr:hypothetical protein HPP92_009464 [Vanilla planifolia]
MRCSTFLSARLTQLAKAEAAAHIGVAKQQEESAHMGRRSSVSQTHMGIFAFDPNLALSHVNEGVKLLNGC